MRSVRISRATIARHGTLWIALIAAAHLSYYFPRVVDDLFISLRFAESFAQGRGIVFNPGERVEGYSSPLWMLLQAIGFVLHFEGVTWTKLLGIVSLAAIAIGVTRLAREQLRTRLLPALLASLLVVLDSHVVAWSVLGLETPAYLALLVWYPIVLRRYLDTRRRRSAWIAGAVAVALACARPEAPMFVAAMGLSELVTRTRSPIRARFVAGVRLAVPVIAVLAVLLLARRAYFGLWLPHTYYVKGATSGFEIAKLTPLVGEGVGGAERLFYIGGGLVAIVLAVTRRAPTLLVAMACSLFFTASVERDWMPSLRHLLPVPVFAAVAWAWAVDRIARSTVLGEASRYVAGMVAMLVAGAGLQIAGVDSRVSLIDKNIGGRPWAPPKTRTNMRDAWLALRGIEPPHVAGMGAFEMGLVTQNYRVLEAAAAPIEDSWYIGRDIGQVGYFTDVRVFDTPGLFTPDVVGSAAWRRDHAVDDELLHRAFARQPVAAELLDAWTSAAASSPDVLAHYDVVAGSPDWPVDLTQDDRPRPSPAEVLRRYEQSLAKFPQWFVLATLYGESVGGAMKKRVRLVRELAEVAGRAPPTTPLGRERGAGARLEGTMESLGCDVSPAKVPAGGELSVTCWWRAVARPTRTYWAFLHFDDANGRGVWFQNDHPAGGFRPTSLWKPGDDVTDFGRVTVPRGTPPGTYRLYFGMWKGELRPDVTPAEMSDGKNRIRGQTVEVVP